MRGSRPVDTSSLSKILINHEAVGLTIGPADFQADDTHLTRTGNAYLRYYFCEAAFAVQMRDRDYGAYFQHKLKEVRLHGHKCRHGAMRHAQLSSPRANWSGSAFVYWRRTSRTDPADNSSSVSAHK